MSLLSRLPCFPRLGFLERARDFERDSDVLLRRPRLRRSFDLRRREMERFPRRELERLLRRSIFSCLEGRRGGELSSLSAQLRQSVAGFKLPEGS